MKKGCSNPNCKTPHTNLTRHHIVPTRDGGGDEPENIEVLCRACHNEVHRFDRPMKPMDFKPTKQERTMYRYEARDNQLPMAALLELIALFFMMLDRIMEGNAA